MFYSNFNIKKVKREYEALENDYNSVKSKTDAFKARLL